MKSNSSQNVETNEMDLRKDSKNKINKDGKVIGDYFELQRGITYKSALLGQEGPLLLGLSTIERHGGFRKDSLQTYSGESPKKIIVNSKEMYVALKDVTQSAELLGAIARLPPNYGVGRLTQDTVKLIPKSDSVPIDYLYWIMIHIHFIHPRHIISHIWMISWNFTYPTTFCKPSYFISQTNSSISFLFITSAVDELYGCSNLFKVPQLTLPQFSSSLIIM